MQPEPSEATALPASFLAGVIEGFYGPHWTHSERLELFDWMAQWGLNTYLYAPKDDLKHRACWRECYSKLEVENLRQVIQACRQRNIHFVFALSPGLTIRYGNEGELDFLKTRFCQVQALGGHHFALLFDDIPDSLEGTDQTRFDSLAAAQCEVANHLFSWTRDREPSARFLFCPTAYCSRMCERQLGGKDYLTTIGMRLMPEIDVCWTGPEIISREIAVAHVQELQAVLRRKPIIWDNLFANDYDGRRFVCGPYAGRPPELRDWVNGVLLNPNNEFPLNYVPLRTFGWYVHSQGTWDARAAYLGAMAEWSRQFVTASVPVTSEDLVLLGDCYYLPHAEGPEAEKLYQQARTLLASDPVGWGQDALAFRRQAGRLREICARMTDLRHRPLFHALSRRLWELREEMDLLERVVGQGISGDPWRSDFHLPGTYRGGLAVRLQRLLDAQPEGTFVPRADISQDSPGGGRSEDGGIRTRLK